jgi:hypothetical protein
VVGVAQQGARLAEDDGLKGRTDGQIGRRRHRSMVSYDEHRDDFQL